LALHARVFDNCAGSSLRQRVNFKDTLSLPFRLLALYPCALAAVGASSFLSAPTQTILAARVFVTHVESRYHASNSFAFQMLDFAAM
jgi:hypothetical protein